MLGRLIEHLVVTNAAAREGVSVSGGDVDIALDRITVQIGGPDKLKAEALKAGIAPADLRQTISDVALRDKLSDKLTANVDVPEASLRAAYQQNIAQFDQVHSAHILVASKALAEKLLAQVKADPSTFAALAAQYSSDTASKAKGGDLGFQGHGALDKVFEAAIFGNPPGSFVIAKTQFGYHVIHVIERHTTTFEQARDDLRRGLLGQQRTDAVAKLLRATAKRLGVHVNPRFGVWDKTALEVAARKADPSKDVSKASPRPGAAGATPQATTGP